MVDSDRTADATRKTATRIVCTVLLTLPALAYSLHRRGAEVVTVVGTPSIQGNRLVFSLFNGSSRPAFVKGHQFDFENPLENGRLPHFVTQAATLVAGQESDYVVDLSENASPGFAAISLVYSFDTPPSGPTDFRGTDLATASEINQLRNVQTIVPEDTQIGLE